MIQGTKGIKMPRKKTEKLVHLDMEALTKKEASDNTSKENTSLGGLLRARRIKKKWEIEDVARKLRIKPIYLEALEQGHYYAFPARSYGVGFLRSYSKILDLNSDDMIALFNQETNDVKEQPLDMLVMEKHFTLPSFKLLIFIVFLISGIYFVWSGIAIHYYPGGIEQFEVIPQLEEKEEPAPQAEEKEESALSSTSDVKPEQEEKKTEEEDISKKIGSAPVAFVATNTVWVGLKNVKTEKMIVSKKFQKDEIFTPETSLEDLALSTGRPKALDLYVNGKKVKTFGRETSLPLAGFSEAPTEKTTEKEQG